MNLFDASYEGYLVPMHVDEALVAFMDERSTSTSICRGSQSTKIRELRTGREPWQRADGTLAHYPDARGLAIAGGAVVYRQWGGTLQLVQFAGGRPLARARWCGHHPPARDAARALTIGRDTFQPDTAGNCYRPCPFRAGR